MRAVSLQAFDLGAAVLGFILSGSARRQRPRSINDYSHVDAKALANDPRPQFALPRGSRGDPLTMSTSRILQRLYSLDTSSPDFLRHLFCLIQHDEKEHYLTSLQGSSLAQLVNFLDGVRTILSASPQLTERISQVLSVIPTTDDVQRQCLQKLQTICGHHTAIPSSCIVSGQIARVGDGPITLGGIADIWEGTCSGKRVFIKYLRVSVKNYQTIKRVRARYRITARLPDDHGRHPVVLPRRRYVEKLEASKSRSFCWCNNESFANNLGMDAERDSPGVHRGKPRRESGQPGESFPVIALDI